MQAAQALVKRGDGANGPALEDFAAAGALAEGLTLGEVNKYTLQTRILTAAVDEMRARKLSASGGTSLLGQPMIEARLRAGLETALRAQARFLTGEERIRLVDEANAARPRTLT